MIAVTVAGPDDWVRVQDVRLASLADSPDAFWTLLADEEHHDEGFWRARLDASNRITVLGTLDGSDVGTMGAGPHHDRPQDAGLYAVWVAPSARGSGVAAAMLEAVVGWAADRGHERLRLDVGDHNDAAISFYLREGFTPTGVASTFPSPRQSITEHEMALDLRPPTS